METINLTDTLCFTGTIDGLYHPEVLNVLTGSKIHGVPSDATSVMESSPLMVSDIPDFLKLEMQPLGANYKVKTIPQYEGYLIDLTRFKDAPEFFSKSLGKNSRKNFRAKQRKLEADHSIRYEFYFGHIEKQHYELLFEVCYQMMEERFREKKIYNRNLLQWKWYYELFYPLILEKKASIFAIYDGEKPITLTLNFHLADIVFSHIQIYDTEYARYSMGDIAVFKNVEWCYRNGFRVWDFSKGATDNKRRWSNHTYRFDYQIIYRDTPVQALKVGVAMQKLRLKQWMRLKGIIGGRFQLDGLYFYTKQKQIQRHDWKNS